jgi:uncharacterized protein YndB with AHSA1/START domain
MTDTTADMLNDTYGTVTAADTVRLERWLPGPVERVWRYLTEPELRAQWLAAGDMELRPGGAVELVFRNNALTPNDDPPPQKYAGMSDLYRLRGHVTECERPRSLAFTWSEESGAPSEVRFELTPNGGRVLLVLTHTRLATRSGMLSVSAGWHTHLAVLLARLQGEAPPAFWRTFSGLEADYDRRLQ